jgi:hypothetical protein
LHFSKALRSSGIQVMRWEPLTLGLERTSRNGASVVSVWSKNRL